MVSRPRDSRCVGGLDKALGVQGLGSCAVEFGLGVVHGARYRTTVAFTSTTRGAYELS